jgi:small-conductance mechanosensitive channel
MGRWSDVVAFFDTSDKDRLFVSLLTAVGALLLGLVVNQVGFWILGQVSRATNDDLLAMLPRYGRRPGQILVPLLLLELFFPSLNLPPRTEVVLEHSLRLALIASCTYLLINTTRLARDAITLRVSRDGAQVFHARKVVTQIKLLQKIVIAVVLLCSAALMLMTFQGIRQVGVSVLASAGLAGIILGLAAQRTLSTLLAGLQIAVTQPIRLGDLVSVEGEVGTIEEMSLTNVVVKVWDLRRLVLPITYFIEKPFQNWTLSSTDLIGTVFLYADYSLPVDAIREEARRAVAASDLWDKKVCNVQVTDMKPTVLELRVVVSAADSGKLFDLRCTVRETLIAFMQKNYPESFPRGRSQSLDATLAAKAGGARPAGAATTVRS